MITQPQENVALPQTLEKAIERAKNSVTLAEAELSRLESLSLGQKSEIKANTLALNEQESKLKGLDKDIQARKEALSVLDKKIEDANSRLDEAEKEVTRLNLAASSLKDKQESEADFIKKETAQLETLRKALESKEKILADKAETVKEKEEKIKDFISSLK